MFPKRSEHILAQEGQTSNWCGAESSLSVQAELRLLRVEEIDAKQRWSLLPVAETHPQPKHFPVRLSVGSS